MKLRIAPPRPSWIDAGSSPMIAPTTLAVAAILKAANRYGSDDGTRSFQSTDQSTGRVGVHQLECARVGRLEAADRVDRYREERQVGGDHRDREPRRQPATAEPDDDHRRDRQDRDRLRGDDVRQQPAAQQGRVDEHDADREAADRADREADHRLLRREERSLPEHLDEQRAVPPRRLEELPDDVPGVRHRPVVDRRKAG